MSRRVFCRYCRHPATVIAGVLPAKCEKCGEEGFWTTDPDSKPLNRRRKHSKNPRVPFALTHQDYKLFLKRIAVSKE